MTQASPNTSTPAPEHLAELVRRHIPDAQVEVGIFSGDDHFEMRVTSAAFAGKSRVAQHKMVYAALGEHMHQRIHALALTTRTPEQQ
jgi:stress-induced morphogen